MLTSRRLLCAPSTLARPFLAAVVIATGSMSSHALSLGRLQVLSGMGEPLRAEVEVNPSSPEQLQNLRAQLAPVSSFQQAGMEYNRALEGLSASVEQRNGRTFIVLLGRQPVQDNFVDLILETQWSTGRLVRNYALLLNAATPKPLQSSAPHTGNAMPAAASPAVSSSRLSEPVAVEYNTQNIPVYRFGSAADASPAANRTASPAPPEKPMAMPAVQSAAPTASANTVTVARGQTASHLAVAHMSGSVSLDQMLIAMLRHNPHAFIEGNVNLIRAGAELQMPSVQQAMQVPVLEARQIVLAQTEDFAAYTRRLAESPLAVVNGSAREVSGKVSARVQTHPDLQASQDTLTLSKTQIGQTSAEVRIAAEREAREASEQMAELSQNIKELNSMVSAAASARTSPPAEGLASTSQDGPQPKPIWMWGAGLAALLMGLLLWRRNRQSPASPNFAPSYDDLPEPALPSGVESTGIPAAMSRIDLNLPTDAQSAAPQPPIDDTANETNIAKLELARLLLAKGDVEIARTLIESVVASGTDEQKASAHELLGQIR